MARKRQYAPLNIFLNARPVGRLVRETSGAIKFTYDDAWLDWQHALPVSISMPLREEHYTGMTVSAVFDNLLPDNEPIRNRLAQRVGADGTDAFSLLAKIGRDCIGALQFLPDDEEPQPTDKLSGTELSSTDIGKLLQELDVTPLGIRSENDFRISVAGAQEKTALLLHNKQWIEPSGTTPTTHILKPQIGRLGNGMDLSNSVENEYFCLKLMQAFGLRTANAFMETFNGVKALVVERFDRKWTDAGHLIRLPQEDCCQALACPSTQKYQNVGGPGIEEIMDILRASDESTQDRHDFFKACILFWLIGATDGHAKNFSLALFPQGRFRLAPLYDVLTLQPSFDNNQIARKDFKLAMRAGKSNHYNVEQIRGRHFLYTGDRSGLSGKIVTGLFDEIRDGVEAALNEAAEAMPGDFPGEMVESVMEGVRQRMVRF